MELRTLEEIEKEIVFKYLEYFGNNKTEAAKALGITVKTLYNKIHYYGRQDLISYHAPRTPRASQEPQQEPQAQAQPLQEISHGARWIY